MPADIPLQGRSLELPATDTLWPSKRNPALRSIRRYPPGKLASPHLITLKPFGFENIGQGLVQYVSKTSPCILDGEFKVRLPGFQENCGAPRSTARHIPVNKRQHTTPILHLRVVLRGCFKIRIIVNVCR